MLFLKTVLDLNQILIILRAFVFGIKVIPMMVKSKNVKLDLDIVFKDKLLGVFIVVLIINTLSYFSFKEKYIINSTNDFKKLLSQNDSLFFSNENIYLDETRISPRINYDKYLTDSTYMLLLKNNTIITLKQSRNDSTKYGVFLSNQIGVFNENPIAIFKKN